MSRRLAATVLATLAVTVMSVHVAEAAPAATFSTRQLDAAKHTLDERLTRPPAGVASWGVDPASGRVSVSVVAGDSEALAAARTATADLPAATIVTVAERPRPLYNIVGGQLLRTSAGYLCSVGFVATSGAKRYLITAGHCTELGGGWAGYIWRPMGRVASSHFPIDDYGTIRILNRAWIGGATVQGSGTTVVPVRGHVEAAVGDNVCRSGVTTGWRCGTIKAKNVTVNYGDGEVVEGLTETDACAEPGDSGGSFITPDGQAQGLTSGGSGDCRTGGTTYFQPINEVLSTLHLTLTTATS